MTTDSMQIGTSLSSVEVEFWRSARRMIAPQVLEIGTKRWEAGFATHHAEWLPEAAAYVRCDTEDGLDVDVIADAHDLRRVFAFHFDIVIAVSVFEHLVHPWLAVESIADVLCSGGLVFIATHQTFPVHGYPEDYYRFTDRGLLALFDTPEWTDQHADYAYPCRIEPPNDVSRWNAEALAYLNVYLSARRT